MKRWLILSALALALPLVAAAETAPDFTAPTLNGKSVQLSDFRGRVVLLDFWASWCGSCRTELPKLTALEREVDGLVVLAVNLDAERSLVESFAAKVQLPARVLLDPRGSVADRYAIPALPWQVLVDAQGRILRQGRRVHDGAEALRKELQQLRSEEAAQK